jgi:hypothetical protein
LVLDRLVWVVGFKHHDVEQVDVCCLVADDALLVVVLVVVQELNVCIFKIELVSLFDQENSAGRIVLFDEQDVEPKFTFERVGANVEALVLFFVVHLFDVLDLVGFIDVENLLEVLQQIGLKVLDSFFL